MNLGVTGADGLIGFHVRALALSCEDVGIVCAGRETFDSTDRLEAFVGRCDAIIHLAGMNRGEEEEVASTNVRLTRMLVEAMEAVEASPDIVFSSSTQIELDNPYGRSKLECAAVLRRWSESGGGRVVDVVLPGVFGEGGRPFYNSVVSTFCHQLAQGEELTVHGDSPLELVHAQAVAGFLLEAARDSSDGRIRLEGTKTTVPQLADRLRTMAASYRANVLPDMRETFDRDLFNTYRSYLFPESCPIPLVKHCDPRGHFAEAVRALGSGQFSYSMTRPGILRGDHFHYHKLERFIVVGGVGELSLRRIFSDEVHTFRVDGDQPVCVDIPTFHAHCIRNVGDSEMITLFWTHDMFDPANPDTVMEDVL